MRRLFRQWAKWGALSAGVVMLTLACARANAQAALLMEQPYGVFGLLNPTGHAAVYLEHVCAETPVKVRECGPGETGTVVSRYKGMAGYDWIAIPLVPYLYSVKDPVDVPAKVTQEQVNRLREHYRESELGEFGEALPKGSFTNGGWTELVGTAYDRTTFAFRFETTREEDRALIADLNERPNASHFNLLFNNCADFDRFVLKHYFPKQFGRAIFPDAGITTPKYITYSLVKYAKKHPETGLTVMEIPQVPGYRHESRAIDGVTESVIKNGYVIPIVVLNPYVAGGIFADYLIRGRYRVAPKNPERVDAMHLEALTGQQASPQPPPAAASALVTPALALTPITSTQDNPSENLRVIPTGSASGNGVVTPALVVPISDSHEE